MIGIDKKHKGKEIKTIIMGGINKIIKITTDGGDHNKYFIYI
jgi:hypothetical protein